MSDEEGDGGRLWLCGYVPLADHGFALPVYGTGPQANAWYVAIPEIDGDHAAAIAGFAVLEDEDVRPLDEVTIQVGVGDLWQDVFLWMGEVIAGPPRHILEWLSPMVHELRQTVPLSLLDLAMACETGDTLVLAPETSAFLQGRLGVEQGAKSFLELVVRPAVMTRMRRLLFHRRAEAVGGDFVRDFDIRETGQGTLEIMLDPRAVELLVGDQGKTDLDHAIGEAGRLLGLTLGWKERGEAAQAPRFKAPSSIYRAGDDPQVGTNLRQPVADAPLPNILIVAADRRAHQIARFIEAPQEIAFGSRSIFDVRRYAISRADQAEGRRLGPADAVLHISDGVLPGPSIDHYAVVVWLAGDEVLKDGEQLERIRELAREAARSGGPLLLIAPALPRDEPSVLSEPGAERLLPNDLAAVIDTSISRSPFWCGQQRRSIDRRMADVIATVAIVTALDHDLQKELRRSKGWKRPPLLCYSVDGAAQRRSWHAVSELTGSRTLSFGKHVTRPGFEVREASGRDSWNARLELGELAPEFGELAEAAIAEATDGSPRHLELDAEGSANMISSTLQHPWMAATVELPRGRAGRLVITGEAPSLQALREAQERDAEVVRYTDRVTLRNWFKDERAGPPRLPAEIRLPPLRRFPWNRGLASRGVDTRDVIRLDSDTWERLLRDHGKGESPLVGEARYYLAAIDTKGRDPEIALAMPGVWNAFNDGDPLARAIIQRSELSVETRIGGKRIADLAAAWSSPAGSARRWVLEDGRVPVELTVLDPQEVPAQRLFFIDGDDAVPALMMSRLFAVWARALLPSSTSWMPRFQVSRTFEALPIPAGFMIIPPEQESPAQLLIADEKRDGRELAEVLHRHGNQLAEAADSAAGDERILRRHPLVRRIDEILLKSLDLKGGCSDLDILEQLVERNRHS